MDDNVVSLKNISKNYLGISALDKVDLVIKKAEIHSLVGENGSGKSTLIKILSGAVQPNEKAEIEIDNVRVRSNSCTESIRCGVTVIYQDLSLFPNLTVEENISVNDRIEKRVLLVNWKTGHRIASEAIRHIGANLDLHSLVGDLSIADQQLVAICRSLAQNAKLIVMDEPTSSLTQREVVALFDVLRDLRRKGISILFISHKIDEVLSISDRVTVLRDGKLVGTYDRQELDRRKLEYLMTQKESVTTKYSWSGLDRKVLLEVRGLSKRGNFKDINLTLQEGEIVGIIGPLGSGRTELALALFGLKPADSGEIWVEGAKARIRSVQVSINHGIGYVPEDRIKDGVVLPKSISSNISITILRFLVRILFFVDEERRRQTVLHWISALAIKSSGPDMPVQNLSGGNQQRVVLAKWLATNPKILILDSPTAGIDVGAKATILDSVRNLAVKGMGIILITDESSEAVCCNRVLIMKRGRIVEEVDTASETEETILAKVNA
jgi:simple sugar transport system ATP-binding protein